MIGKTVLAAAAALAIAVPAAAQHAQHQGKHEGEGMMKGMMETPWREMNGFHSLLHLSHQPLMKTADLAPARLNAGRLAEAAQVWAKSTAPAECKAPADIGETLMTLATEVQAYSELVAANGSDADVKDALGKIHDRFEAAHMACMPMGMEGMKGMKGMKDMDKKGPPPR